jgi:hypothetical protein
MKAGAIELRHCEDMWFRNLQVFKCGAYDATEANKVYGMAIFESEDLDPLASGSNSVSIIGGDFERNHDSGLYLDGCVISQITGTKFHGRTYPQDDATPNEVVTLTIKGSAAVVVNGCQFSNSRYASIKVAYGDTYSRITRDIRIIGCTFRKPINYVNAGDCTHIWIKGAQRTSIIGCAFDYVDAADYKADIWLEDYDGTYKTNYTTVIGQLRHPTLPIKNDATGTNNNFLYTLLGDWYGAGESWEIAIPLTKDFNIKNAAAATIFGVNGENGLNVLTTNGPAGTVTLGANVATTTVNNSCVTANSLIFLFPTTANAAADVGAAASIYISAKVAGTSFTIAHTNDADADKTFNYLILN